MNALFTLVSVISRHINIDPAHQEVEAIPVEVQTKHKNGSATICFREFDRGTGRADILLEQDK